MKTAVYFQSWSSKWASMPANLDLANVEGYDIIYLAFARPDCSYIRGSLSYGGTGLDFPSDFKTVAVAVDLLRSKGVTVMLSVGGATYSFDNFNPQALVDLAHDLNCNGIDIDWEPITETGVLTHIITELKTVSADLKISLAAFSVGAYGIGDFKESLPQSYYTGLNVTGITEAGYALDWINIMAYDAGTSYDPIEAYKAYRAIYSGPLYLGCEVGQEAWGGALVTLDQCVSMAQHVSADPVPGGMFIWSYQKDGNPSTQQVHDAIVGKTFTPQPPVHINPPPYTPPVVAPSNNNRVSGVWRPWVHYIAGVNVLYQHHGYKCTQSHVSQPDWTPDVSFSLWNKIY